MCDEVRVVQKLSRRCFGHELTTEAAQRLLTEAYQAVCGLPQGATRGQCRDLLVDGLGLVLGGGWPVAMNELIKKEFYLKCKIALLSR